MNKHQQVNEKMTIVLNELMGKKTKMPMAEVRRTLLRIGKRKMQEKREELLRSRMKKREIDKYLKDNGYAESPNSVVELDEVYRRLWSGRWGQDFYPSEWGVYDWNDRFSRWIKNNPEYDLVRERVGKVNRNWIVRK